MELVIKTQGKKLEALMAVLKALDISFTPNSKTKSEASPYSPTFVAKIKESQQQAANGEYITIKDTANIWESISSK